MTFLNHRNLFILLFASSCIITPHLILGMDNFDEYISKNMTLFDEFAVGQIYKLDGEYVAIPFGNLRAYIKSLDVGQILYCFVGNTLTTGYIKTKDGFELHRYDAISLNKIDNRNIYKLDDEYVEIPNSDLRAYMYSLEIGQVLYCFRGKTLKASYTRTSDVYNIQCYIEKERKHGLPIEIKFSH